MARMREFVKSSLFILSMLLISALFPVVSASLLQEDDNFEPIHQGIDFPIGWSDINIGFGPNSQGFEMIYPAMTGGSDDEMAGNGPFPWVLFFGSDGEAQDGYMELTSEIVKRGYIVLVSQEMSDSNDLTEGLEIAQTALELMNNTNNSHAVILGGFGNVDVNHWALSGHGVGAMTATSLYPYWLASDDGNTTHGPSGIFAVGADFSSWNQQFRPFAATDWQAPVPNTGLFITGTTDEVAPAPDAISRLQTIKDFSWQMMHLLGANHYQFQDTTSIFENDDGDATMSKEAQLDLSSNHIVAYLDAVLRGDHSRFRDAFNRPVTSSVVSDPDSYVVENLSSADWLKVGALWSVPNNNESMGPEDTVNLKMDWTLRNGLNYSQLPSEWNVTVVCAIESVENETIGQIDADGVAVCLFPMADVQPGHNRLTISVYVEGAPSHRHLDIVRTDSPLVVLTPPAIIDIPQRGSTHVENGLIAYDPDGQSVFLDNATLVGQNSQHFHFQIDSDNLGFTVFHSVDEEWTGLNNLRLELRAGGQTLDETTTEITLRVMPVDDPASLIKNVPLQEMNEDSEPIMLNLSEYVFDPEGEEIAGLVNMNTSSELGPVSIDIADGVVTITPLANQHGAVVIHMLVGDGFNTALNLDIPINVLAVDDILVSNNSAWNINATEDESIVLDLRDFAYDIDGDPLIWSIEGVESSKCNFVIAGNDLMVNVKPDKYGICNSQSLNVTDGITTYSAILNVTIAPQPDLPTITIGNVNLIDKTAATVQWDLTDLDEEQQADVSFYLENVSQNVTSSCTTDESQHTSICVTMLVLPQQHDGNITITIRVTDLELNQTVGIEYTLDMNIKPATEETENVQSDSISSKMIIGITGLLLGIVVVIIITKNSDSNAQLLRQQLPNEEQKVSTEEVDSDAESEVESSTSGLLARAKNM
ncbi:MAG: hypothetical protein NZ736_00895 [Candidatus Poseidoniaceae archaeon]|nr:hypothetical protein [Candidatus Poseidoniaceae archaeon]